MMEKLANISEFESLRKANNVSENQSVFNFEYKNEVDEIVELRDSCWADAVPFLNRVMELGIYNEVMDHLEGLFGGSEELPTLTEVNDYLRFESDNILGSIGGWEQTESGDWVNEDGEKFWNYH